MINKFQLGGNIEQQLALELVAGGVPEQTVSQLAQNKELWGQLVQIYQQEGIQGVAKALQSIQLQATRSAKHGAKLQYIKSLKHQCAEDEELYYYKNGGSVGCGCKKKEGGEILKASTTSAIEKFKIARALSGNKMMQLAEANSERKKKEAEKKKWNKGLVVVGRDLPRGNKNTGPNSKGLDEHPVSDKGFNKGYKKNAKGGEITKACGGIAAFKNRKK